jgi:NADPH2:quinone reductase
VLITGATGGVGAAAVQIARAMKCDVVAVTSSEDKVPFLKNQLGVENVLLAKTPEQLATFFRSPLLRGGVDMAFDAVGAPTFEPALRSLKPGGRLVLIGNVTAGEVPLKLGLTIINELKIIGGEFVVE